MPNPVMHFEIMGADSQKYRQYYADLFGWNLDNNNPMNYGMARTKDGGVATDGAWAALTRAATYGSRVSVDATQAYLHKAVALGAKWSGV